MSRWKCLFVVGALLRARAGFCQSTPAEPNAPRTGYVVCAEERNPPQIQIYENPCKPPVGEIHCGESVEVVSRRGPYFKMSTSDGSERYIGTTAVSQSKKQFIPIDLPYVPWPNLEDCSAFHGKEGGTHRPIPLFSPNPELSEKARRAKISGSVTLSFTVGADGLVHDIVVTKSLGYGLDENAVAAVQKWKFDPATKNGKPVPARMAVEVDFKQ